MHEYFMYLFPFFVWFLLCFFYFDIIRTIVKFKTSWTLWLYSLWNEWVVLLTKENNKVDSLTFSQIFNVFNRKLVIEIFAVDRMNVLQVYTFPSNSLQSWVLIFSFVSWYGFFYIVSILKTLVLISITKVVIIHL